MMKIWRETIRDIRTALRAAAALPDDPPIERVISARFYAQHALAELDRDLLPDAVEVEEDAK